MIPGPDIANNIEINIANNIENGIKNNIALFLK